MLRAAAIALGVSLVAFAALGMRDGVASTEPGSEIQLSPAPLESAAASPEADALPQVSFMIPERELSPAWTAPQIALENEAEGGDEAPFDFFPFDAEASAAAQDAGWESEPLQFPKREDWDSFSRRLDLALAAGSMERLVELEPEAASLLQALRAIPGHVEYADWLEARLEDITIAKVAAELDRALAEDDEGVPLYDAWLDRMRDRPPPARAADFVPRLKPFFVAAQVPPALVWLAETESNFNPSARNRVGARGLYQIMPATARELGLRLRPHDERLNPLLNAQSAARYLAYLHDLYTDWPLALAAYNAGPTRVSRLLKQRGARSYAEIADHLPTETQLYVPRVLATLAVREGVTPGALALTQAALAAH